MTILLYIRRVLIGGPLLFCGLAMSAAAYFIAALSVLVVKFGYWIWNE